MRHVCTRFGLAVALGVVLSCGESPLAPSAATAEQPTEKLSTAHFTILADRVDATTLRAIADALESAYPRMTADLQTGDLSPTSVWVWSGSAAFEAAMRQNLGQAFPGSTGYVFGARSLAVLAVSSVVRNASHEFAHIVSLAVNPRIGNNPRWLWESIAVYENGEFVAPMTLDYMRAGRYPTLAQLDADFNSSRQIYEVGFVLGEFVVATWGPDGLIRLIRVNGDVASALGVAVTEFESRWYGFLRAKYGTP